MKKGDTLIEVAIAIGIFSMVAVAVIGVVSSSTSNAQSSLETTVTREIIDAEGEALRFIQSAYIAGGRANVQDEDNELEKYAKIWDILTSHAVDQSRGDVGNIDSVLRFNPKTCQEIYAKPLEQPLNSAFVINTRRLGFTKAEADATGMTLENFIKNNVVINQSESDKLLFTTTSTYPRIVYGEKAADSNSALDQYAEENNIYSIEGIFINAVRDPGTTVVSGGSGNVTITERSAYYDFYIHTCWYNPGADRPSTISTVVRLQDPSTITYGDTGIAKRVIITFDKNADDATGYMPTQSISSGKSATLRENDYALEGYDFNGWNTEPDDTGEHYNDKGIYIAESPLSFNKSVTLYAIWKKKPEA